MPEVDIDADEAAPETRLVPEVIAVDDDVTVVKDESGDDDETEVAADASPAAHRASRQRSAVRTTSNSAVTRPACPYLPTCRQLA
jgi:hypothetical protein